MGDCTPLPQWTAWRGHEKKRRPVVGHLRTRDHVERTGKFMWSARDTPCGKCATAKHCHLQAVSVAEDETWNAEASSNMNFSRRVGASAPLGCRALGKITTEP